MRAWSRHRRSRAPSCHAEVPSQGTVPRAWGGFPCQRAVQEIDVFPSVALVPEKPSGSNGERATTGVARPPPGRKAPFHRRLRHLGQMGQPRRASESERGPGERAAGSRRRTSRGYSTCCTTSSTSWGPAGWRRNCGSTARRSGAFSTRAGRPRRCATARTRQCTGGTGGGPGTGAARAHRRPAHGVEALKRHRLHVGGVPPNTRIGTGLPSRSLSAVPTTMVMSPGGGCPRSMSRRATWTRAGGRSSSPSRPARSPVTAN